MRKLTAVQRRAAGHSILGCFRTTSAALVDTELHLTPIPIALRLVRLNALTGMASLLGYARVATQRTLHWSLKSLLEVAEEELVLQAGIDAAEIGTRWPIITPAWWEPPSVTTEPRKDLGITAHGIHRIAYTNVLKIYTDGSGIDGQVGAAAVSLEPGREAATYMSTAPTDPSFVSAWHIARNAARPPRRPNASAKNARRRPCQAGDP